MSGKFRFGEKPLNLHIAPTWGGGLSAWVADFCNEDQISENLVLESFGTEHNYGSGLRLRHSQTDQFLDKWLFREPISEVQVSHSEYKQILCKISDQYQIEHLYVSSLIGHSLDIFSLKIPTTVVYHDHFPYCPAFFLTKEAQCTTCTVDDLKDCKDFGVGLRPKNSPTYYIRFRDAYFRSLSKSDVHHVAPCAQVPRDLRKIDSRFDQFEFAIIEHGIPFGPRDLFAGAADRRRLRIGIIGDLPWYKGLKEFERWFGEIRTIADVSLIGSQHWAASIASRWGVHYVERYEREDLPDILEERKLDAALFLSMVPESFSLTLSEMWCFGIPPIARRIGAHGYRIKDRVNGFLFGLTEGSVVEALLDLDRDREKLRMVNKRLLKMPIRRISDCVADYYSLRTQQVPRN